MRGRPARNLAALIAAAAAIAAAPAGQSWRGPALASFDEAWQAIHDTYYDPTFGGLDWAGVRAELRPRAAAAASPDAVRSVIRDMLARLGQSHFTLIASDSAGRRPHGGARVPIDVRVNGEGLVVTRVEPGSSAVRSGITPGVLITAVDDETVSRWWSDARGSDERRRKYDVYEQAAAALSGPDGSRARLRVRTDGREEVVSVAREAPRGVPVQFGNLPTLSVRVSADERRTAAGRRAGLIAWSVWMPAASAAIDAAVDRFRAADGLVLDLRGNPGGLVEMIRGVAGHVLDEPISLGRMQTRQATLELSANPRRSTSDGRRVVPFGGPVAILVDELTASASECFAGGLQSLGRARVFGGRTMGQALPAATRRLSNGDVLLHALGDFVTGAGERLEGRGVVPDVEVAPTLEALRAGRDPALDRALDWIDAAAGVPGSARLP
jgi:carboxyl-terminal processing protease